MGEAPRTTVDDRRGAGRQAAAGVNPPSVTLPNCSSSHPCTHEKQQCKQPHAMTQHRTMHPLENTSRGALWLARAPRHAACSCGARGCPEPLSSPLEGRGAKRNEVRHTRWIATAPFFGRADRRATPASAAGCVDHQILDYDRRVTMQASVGATAEIIGISSEVSYVIPIWKPEILSITSI